MERKAGSAPHVPDSLLQRHCYGETPEKQEDAAKTRNGEWLSEGEKPRSLLPKARPQLTCIAGWTLGSKGSTKSSTKSDFFRTYPVSLDIH